MKVEQRPLGNSKVRVSEIGLQVSPGDAAADIVRHARSAGIDLFHLEKSDSLPWLAEALGPAAVTVLIGTQAPPIGGTYLPDAEDAHLELHSYSPLADAQGALGPYRVLGGWSIGSPSPSGAASRLDLVRGVIADRTSQAVGMTYSLADQATGLGVSREVSKAGAGVLALDVADIPPGQFDFLVTPKRTLLQAAILFVQANQYVTSAIVRVETRAQLAEVVASIDAEGLSMGELEQVMEMYIHRNDGGKCSR